LLKSQRAEEDHLVTFTLPVAEPLPPQYFVKVWGWGRRAAAVGWRLGVGDVV